jgi:hypothetical protein
MTEQGVASSSKETWLCCRTCITPELQISQIEGAYGSATGWGWRNDELDREFNTIYMID